MSATRPRLFRPNSRSLSLNELIEFLRFWLLPPLLGGVIGYITNAIAIRMLFRPLKEVRVLGIRLPFTPGVIPRQRYQLSQSIAQLITEQLLTSEAVLTQFADEKLREELKTRIGKLISQLMGTRLKDLLQTRIPFLAEDLAALLKALAKRLAHTQAFQKLIDLLLAELTQKISHLKLAGLCEGLKPVELLVQGLEKLLNDRETSRRLADGLSALLKSEAGRPDLGQSLADTVSLLTPLIWPLFKDSLASWLDSKPMQELLKIKGKEFLADVFAKLNTLQRLFLSLGQYERSLKEAMPELIADLTKRLEEILQNPIAREGLQESLTAKLKDRLAQLVARDTEGVSKKITPLCQKAISLARSLKLPQVLAQRLNHYLSQHAQCEMGQLLAWLSPSRQAELKAGLEGLLKSIFYNVDFFTVLNEFSQETHELSLGQLVGLSSERRLKLEEKLAGAFIQSFSPALKLLDLKTFIVKKIDALSVKDVENMLLTVIAKHFKWINIFGAILGSLIGLGQTLLRLL